MWGRTAKILALNEQGLTLEQIAKEMSCTKSNIIQTLKRHREWNRTVAPLPKEHYDWIVKQALKARVMPPLFVADLLVKIIDKVIEKERENGK